MEITNKSVHDPVADLHVVDAYMRWALLAAEEVAGKSGLVVVLRQAKLERFIDNYPPNELKVVPYPSRVVGKCLGVMAAGQ